MDKYQKAIHVEAWKNELILLWWHKLREDEAEKGRAPGLKPAKKKENSCTDWLQFLFSFLNSILEAQTKAKSVEAL